MRQPSDLELRVAAADAVLAEWLGRPFVWGVTDCVHLAAAALVARGHETRLGEALRYRSFAGSRRVLKALGYASLEAALDGHGLARIPPAAALAGDLVALPSASPAMPSLFVALGNGRVLGFFEGAARIGHPLAFVAAWRT